MRMNGRYLFIALVALSGSLLGSAAFAADQPGETSASPPTLSDRLEQFRRDLIGEPGGAERRAAADREVMRDEAGQDDIRPESAAQSSRRSARRQTGFVERSLAAGGRSEDYGNDHPASDHHSTADRGTAAHGRQETNA